MVQVVGRVVDITPDFPVILGANGHPGEPHRRVADPLEANILVVRAEGPPFVMVSCDLLYIGSGLRRTVESRLASRIPADRLWMGASHTHRAPATDAHRPALGVANASYVQGVADRISQAVEAALDEESGCDAQPVLLTARAHHSINRRRRRPFRVTRSGLAVNTISLGPNTRGATHEQVARLDFVASNRVVATVWSYACHPTAHPDRLAISADYPGVVRRRMRQSWGDQNSEPTPVLFFQGFSGDTRSPSIASLWTDPLRALRTGRFFRDFTEEEFGVWSESLADLILRDSSLLPTRGEFYGTRRCQLPLEDFAIGGLEGRVVNFHRMSLGPVDFVGVSSELVTDYVGVLKAFQDVPRPIVGVGCLDDVFGYAPTTEQIREGGYEAGGFCANFGLQALNPSVEEAVKRGFAQVARR